MFWIGLGIGLVVAVLAFIAGVVHGSSTHVLVRITTHQ